MTTAEIKLRQGDWEALKSLETDAYIYPNQHGLSKSMLMRYKRMELLNQSESGAFSLTLRAREIIAHPPEPPPKRMRRTEKLIAHVELLPDRGITHGDIKSLLEEDATRGIDTSPKFMRGKGRRLPRKNTSDRPRRTE